MGNTTPSFKITLKSEIEFLENFSYICKMGEQVLTNEMVIEKYYELNSVTAVAKYFHKSLEKIRGILRGAGIDTLNPSKSKINPITNEKVCTKCLMSKSLDSYRLNKLGKYSASCRSCLNKHRMKLAKEQ